MKNFIKFLLITLALMLVSSCTKVEKTYYSYKNPEEQEAYDKAYDSSQEKLAEAVAVQDSLTYKVVCIDNVVYIINKDTNKVLFSYTSWVEIWLGIVLAIICVILFIKIGHSLDDYLSRY